MEQGPSAHFDLTTASDGVCRLQLTGRLDARNVARLQADALTAVGRQRPRQLHMVLSDVAYLDDFGALLLTQIRDRVVTDGGTVRLVDVPENVERMLSLIHFREGDVCRPILPVEKPDPVTRFGAATLGIFFNMRYLVSFLGSVILSFGRAIRRPRSVRWNDTVEFMEKVGVEALPIVGLISFLLGLVMAFTSALQLRQFGANIYVASLVALAMVSELGPIMTAIVVAGRSGSAFAAEIGTMRISEEIDALYIMGFGPTFFLALPRILAAMLVVPLLTLFSDIFAIFGGLVVGVTMLNLTATSYMSQTIETLTLFEVMWGLSKSVVFAAVIAWVGCLRGFQTRGGAASVGSAATSAVVSGIFLIILFDSIFAVIRSYW